MVTDLDGNFIIQVGATGEDGLNDGNFDSATFNRPQVRSILLNPCIFFGTYTNFQMVL